MLCALSGVVPEVPVVSVKTGLLFEKRLIETHLETSGRCPVTDQDLGKEDLVEVKHSDIARPRPVAAQSIPGLLQAQQTEWDAVMLENFQLKKQLDMARQELSHTLYRHDAACRVIARLMKERDEAVAALSSFDAHAAAHKEKKKAGPQSILPDDVVKRINEQAEILGSSRKKNRVISSTLASKDTVKAFTEQSSMAPHSSTTPGVLCVSHLNGLTLTGGVDSDAVLVNESSKAIVQKLQGHTKPVTQVLVSDRHLYTSSLDGTSRVWSKNAGDAYKTVAEYKDHTSMLADCSPTPPHTLSSPRPQRPFAAWPCSPAATSSSPAAWTALGTCTTCGRTPGAASSDSPCPPCRTASRRAPSTPTAPSSPWARRPAALRRR